jgi:hypothetical protein
VAHGLGFVANKDIQASMDSRATQQAQFNILWSTRLPGLSNFSLVYVFLFLKIKNKKIAYCF